MLEQGPYVIKYEVRHNNNTHDVSIYVDDKLIKVAKGEGVSSDKLKVIGTNYHDYNKLVNNKDRGRRPVDYLKFVPKELENENKNTKPQQNTAPQQNTTPKQTAVPQQTSAPQQNTTPQQNSAPQQNTTPKQTVAPQQTAAPPQNTTPQQPAAPPQNTTQPQQQTKQKPQVIEGFSGNDNYNLNNDERSRYTFMHKMCQEEGIFCNKIQKFNIDLKTGQIHYNLDKNNKNNGENNQQENKQATDADSDYFLEHISKAMDENKDGLVSRVDLRNFMNEFYIRNEQYEKVLNTVRPEGMDFKTFSSLIGQPVKLILRNIYNEHGINGLKMTYKILGYEYAEDPEGKSRANNCDERERKMSQQQLKQKYPETEYDKSKPSKTRYRSDYKPQHPRPKNGVHFYDSIWDFNKY